MNPIIRRGGDECGVDDMRYHRHSSLHSVCMTSSTCHIPPYSSSLHPHRLYPLSLPPSLIQYIHSSRSHPLLHQSALQCTPHDHSMLLYEGVSVDGGDVTPP